MPHLSAPEVTHSSHKLGDYTLFQTTSLGFLKAPGSVMAIPLAYTGENACAFRVNLQNL